MDEKSLQDLTAFIVLAKSSTYVGGGEHSASCRPGSHDLHFARADWSYIDSYFGGCDFIGEEVVYLSGRPTWAMNYYGRILQGSLISPAQAGEVIQASLSNLYKEGRFLGGFTYQHHDFLYTDSNEGVVTSFHGREFIRRAGSIVYELFYHGGLILEG